MYFSQSHSGSIMCESVSTILCPSLIFLSARPANSGKVSPVTTAQCANTSAHPGLYASRDEYGYPCRYSSASRRASLRSDTAVHGVREYNVSGLLADHINRADDEETGYPRKNRCVHDAQSCDVVDTKAVVDHSATFLRPDLAGA